MFRTTVGGTECWQCKLCAGHGQVRPLHASFISYVQHDAQVFRTRELLVHHLGQAHQTLDGLYEATVPRLANAITPPRHTPSPAPQSQLLLASLFPWLPTSRPAVSLQPGQHQVQVQQVKQVQLEDQVQQQVKVHQVKQVQQQGQEETCQLCSASLPAGKFEEHLLSAHYRDRVRRRLERYPLTCPYQGVVLCIV